MKARMVGYSNGFAHFVLLYFVTNYQVYSILSK